MSPLDRVERALEAYKRGEMLIVMDDEDRENEGDLVLAGIFSTPEKINFMAKYARGLICVAITQEIANKLDLPPMVISNDSNHRTAFTISIDAKEAKTGISAFERDLTIQLMCKEDAKPSDFVRPGHIFPLIARDGGVLVRTGHTEAGVDLCRLAGLKPVSIICEIMKEDGSMARRGDKFISEFAREHDLKILYTSDLVAFRTQKDSLISQISAQSVQFLGNACEKITFKDHLDREHFALRFDGEGNEPLVKFELLKSSFEFLSHQEKFNFFVKAAERIAQVGGAIIFLEDMARDGAILKNIGIGAQILKALDLNNFTLLSNSSKIYNALGGFNITITRTLGHKDL